MECGRPRHELFAASESTFFTRDPDSELTFVKGAGENHIAAEARKVE